MAIGQVVVGAFAVDDDSGTTFGSVPSKERKTPRCQSAPIERITHHTVRSTRNYTERIKDGGCFFCAPEDDNGVVAILIP